MMNFVRPWQCHHLAQRKKLHTSTRKYHRCTTENAFIKYYRLLRLFQKSITTGKFTSHIARVSPSQRRCERSAWICPLGTWCRRCRCRRTSERRLSRRPHRGQSVRPSCHFWCSYRDDVDKNDRSQIVQWYAIGVNVPKHRAGVMWSGTPQMGSHGRWIWSYGPAAIIFCTFTRKTSKHQ